MKIRAARKEGGKDRWRVWFCVIAAAFPSLQDAAFAQAWPAKPLRLVVPFSVGGATDPNARTVSDKLAAQFGQAIIVENRPGEGGTMGAAAVTKAEPNGSRFSCIHPRTP